MTIRARDYRAFLKDPQYLRSLALSALLFVASVIFIWFAGVYATEHASNSVTDIVLSNTPIFNLDSLFVYGTMLFIAFIFVVLALDPKRFPFTLYSLALFFFIRAIFISLTHLGPFPIPQTVDFGETVTKFFFGADLFFSGHTGSPFLLALLFWQEKKLRYVFLLVSAAFATIVLLAHLHYTIDVLSAFFITYGIFQISEKTFPRARRLFFEGLPSEYKK